MHPSFAALPYCAEISRPDAHIVVLGACEGTPYQIGRKSHAADAPAAIRAASMAASVSKAGHFDFEFDGPLLPNGVRATDAGDVPGDPGDPAGNRERITAAVRAVLAAGALPLVIGGDDSVPIPVLRAFEGRGPLTVVQVDAHIDWRHDIGGEIQGYSSTMRRASEMPWVRGMVQVGMRGVGSARPAEVQDAQTYGSRLIRARQVHGEGVRCALDAIPDGAECFVLVDCDGLDPSVMPAVLSLSPGGLGYWEVVELLHGVAAKGRIAGFALTEFMPERDTTGAAALTAARLVCNALGLMARGVGGAT